MFFVPVSYTHLVIGSAVYHVTKNNQRKIEVHVPDDVLMVPMDAKLIQQVIINLLDNAMKHTPKDKSIYVDAYEKDQEAYICLLYTSNNYKRL